jgi:predicted nucleic acid-binding protein
VSVAYVDTSCLVAAAFGERGAAQIRRRLEAFDVLIASNLLEAELRAAFAREDVAFDERLLAPVSWIFPTRSLANEIAQILSAGYLRGADLWHLAVALFAVPEQSGLTFLTLDRRQEGVAERLGLAV